MSQTQLAHASLNSMLGVLDRTSSYVEKPVVLNYVPLLVPATEIPLGNPVNVQDVKHIKMVYNKLFSVMANRQNAAGLSAVQIGIPDQICLINTPTAFLCLVNANYQGLGKQIVSEEECLSLPGETWAVPRYESIWLKTGYVYTLTDHTVRKVEKYFDTDTVKFYNHLAIVAQHEIDHGFGKLISDWPNNRKS